MNNKEFHVTISIVTWNSEEYIGGFLQSLKNQSFKDFHIIIVDNASKDKTMEIVQKYDNITCIKNSANLGFSRAHNKGIELAMKFWQVEPHGQACGTSYGQNKSLNMALARGAEPRTEGQGTIDSPKSWPSGAGDKNLNDRFIFVCNPDVVLAEDCLEKILLAMCREPDIGSAGPRLLRLENEEPDNSINVTKTNIVDSLGLEFFKSRKAIDRFSGMEYGGPWETQEVFGVSGAFMCFRASALSAVRWGREYFDEDFFAYKEDADIAWRLKNLDWRSVIIPSAVAYHHRGIRGNLNLSLWEKLKRQKRKPQIIKFLSLRNHLWMICKNDFFVNHLADWPFIFFTELGKFFYYLALDTKSVRAYFSALRGLPKMLSKRAYLRNAKVHPHEIREWFR